MKKREITVILSVIQILICVVFLSSATWSWLSEGINNDSNFINSSTFDINVSFDGENINNSIIENEYGYLVTLTEASKYEISISIVDDSTAKNGYCKIVANSAGSLTKYYYKNIIQQGIVNSTLTFVIETYQTDVKLLFIPCMGLAANNSFEANEAYLAINFDNSK